jgi:hypothetical protein
MTSAKVISLAPKCVSDAPKRWTSRLREWFLPGSVPLPVRRISLEWQDGRLRSKNAALCASVLGVDPETACAILVRDLPDDAMVSVKADNAINQRFSLKISGAGYSDTRRFSLQDRSVDTGYFFLDDGLQKKGLGRKMMRNQVEFFHAIGQQIFSITAASRVGGYAWARFGFLPVNLDDDNELQDALHARFDIIKDCLTDEEQKQVIPFLDLREPRHLWHLADNRIVLGDRLKDIFGSAAGQAACQKYPIYGANLQDLVWEYTRHARKDKVLTLGQVLLVGTAWDGVLDLTSPEQMQRAGNYVGGWKYIAVTGDDPCP